MLQGIPPVGTWQPARNPDYVPTTPPYPYEKLGMRKTCRRVKPMEKKNKNIFVYMGLPSKMKMMTR